MGSGISRRELLKGGTAGLLTMGAALEAGAGEQTVPQRVLGKTGVRVPVIGYGTAPTGSKRSLEDAILLYNTAIDLGITYFDTAPRFTGYGNAQVQLGHVVPDRRKEVFLVTKLWEPDMDDALRLLEQNLKEMRVDHVDLLYAHSIGSDKMDPEKVMGKRGVMAALEKARKEGLTRFIGITGHDRPGRFLPMLEQFDFDVMMNAVNLADRYTYNFEGKVWPVAAKKQVGLVAMKIFGGICAGGQFSSRAMPDEHVPLAFRYALGLPNLSCAVIGMATREEMHRNIEWARSFKPLNEAEQAEAEQIGRQVAARWGAHFGPA